MPTMRSWWLLTLPSSGDSACLPAFSQSHVPGWSLREINPWATSALEKPGNSNKAGRGWSPYYTQGLQHSVTETLQF